MTFSDNLVSSFNASASAGETNAASSSRSTAASQRDDEEEVEEVDEVAFQNLKNYDENPQGILLPQDQTFAFDNDGNGYLIVTLAGDQPMSPPQSETLFRVDLDWGRSGAPYSVIDEEVSFGFRPDFVTLSTAGGDD